MKDSKVIAVQANDKATTMPDKIISSKLEAKKDTEESEPDFKREY